MKYVWEQIKEAIDFQSSVVTTKQIKQYVLRKWPETNPKTIDAQIQILSVNHDSRINYEMNKKKRFTNTNSKYDILFKLGRGVYEKYNPEIHGVWEIFKNEKNKYEVRKTVLENIVTYSPEDIIWFKNVTNTEFGQAYLDITKDTFVLNFPLRHRKNILSPKKDDLILLYQKVNGIACFTHIVTPINGDEYDENIRSNYRYGREVKVIAKTQVLNAIPITSTLWTNINLSGVVNGNACQIDHIKGITNIDSIRINTWEHFRDFFVSTQRESFENISSILNELKASDPAEKEGGLKLVSHLARERNRKIVALKKQEALEKNKLFCEVCTFSFINTFGSEFIECHHIIPISQGGERETKLSDLSCVCSNCHRMLHRKFDGKYLSIKELKDKLQKINAS